MHQIRRLGIYETGSSQHESTAASTPCVFIILLNWNTWKHTIECLESVLRLNYKRFTVIVCDNASSDGSVEKIERWARGEILATSENPQLGRFIHPPLSKPLPFVTLDCSQTSHVISPDCPITVLRTGANLGHTGGNNAGIRFALAQPECDYVWLLNNDTVVEPDALSVLVRMAEADPILGITGSLLRDYHAPAKVITAGGRRYSRWSARTRPLPDPDTPQITTMPGAPDYMEGASNLIRRAFLETIGLLEEGYFLYYDELNWAARAAGSPFRFGFSPKSVVYHKEGGSIGSALQRADRSPRSEFYLARNRLVFTRRFHPWHWPTVLAFVGASILTRLLIGRRKNAAAILRGALASLSPTLSHGKGFD